MKCHEHFFGNTPPPFPNNKCKKFVIYIVNTNPDSEPKTQTLTDPYLNNECKRFVICFANTNPGFGPKIPTYTKVVIH
jgi:hypothetical protein